MRHMRTVVITALLVAVSGPVATHASPAGGALAGARPRVIQSCPAGQPCHSLSSQCDTRRRRAEVSKPSAQTLARASPEGSGMAAVNP